MALRKFLMMVDTDVVTDIYFDDRFAHNKVFADSMLEGVSVLEVDPEADVWVSDTYDGVTFTKATVNDCTCHRCVARMRQ